MVCVLWREEAVEDDEEGNHARDLHPEGTQGQVGIAMM